MHHTADKRIRGRKLQAIRELYFRANPLCVLCEQKGITRLATQLDHTKALANGGTDTHDNRQGLCSDCHDIKTAADMNYKPAGCDISGMPIDPRHPWNK